MPTSCAVRHHRCPVAGLNCAVLSMARTGERMWTGSALPRSSIIARCRWSKGRQLGGLRPVVESDLDGADAACCAHATPPKVTGPQDSPALARYIDPGLGFDRRSRGPAQLGPVGLRAIETSQL